MIEVPKLIWVTFSEINRTINLNILRQEHKSYYFFPILQIRFAHRIVNKKRIMMTHERKSHYWECICSTIEAFCKLPSVWTKRSIRTWIYLLSDLFSIKLQLTFFPSLRTFWSPWKREWPQEKHTIKMRSFNELKKVYWHFCGIFFRSNTFESFAMFFKRLRGNVTKTDTTTTIKCLLLKIEWLDTLQQVNFLKINE